MYDICQINIYLMDCNRLPVG